MKNRVVFSLFLAALALLPFQSRAEDVITPSTQSSADADAVRLDHLRVYFLSEGKGVAVAVPEDWKEVSATRVVEPGASIKFRDEKGHAIQIPAEAVARAFQTKSVLFAYDFKRVPVAAGTAR
jgi:hypothetical protein